MAREKKDSDLIPVEVMAVGTARMEQFHPWAMAVAQTIIDQNLSKSWIEKNPVEFNKLQYAIAMNLVHANTNQVSALQSLCAEMYQIVGSFVELVPTKVLDKLRLAMDGNEQFAEIQILPYVVPDWVEKALTDAKS